MDGESRTEEQDIRLTFDCVPETYERVRPTYPETLFDRLFDALPESPRIVEVGPGTGQATGDLLSRGAHVTAVEIGPALAQFMEAKFAGNDSLTVINASFEDADLAPHSFDAITCATMYHWISPEDQVQRPLDLLKPGGVLGVIDLIQVDSETDRGYFGRVQPIYDSFGKGDGNGEPKSYDTAQPLVAARLEASGRYETVEVYREPWDQTYTATEYRDLLMTYSGTQMMAEPERSDMLDQLIAVVEDEYDGVMTRPLVATLTLARSYGP